MERLTFEKISPFHKNQAVNLQQNVYGVTTMAHKLFILIAINLIALKFFGQPSPLHLSLKLQHSDSSAAHRLIAFSPGKDYYTKNLSFFCRQEWKFEKATRLPLRFRVGSLAQCNLLEGKK